MNSELIQVIGLGVLILAEQYMISPWQFTFFARLWDIIARFSGWLSWTLGHVSVRARANYFVAVNHVE